MDAKKRKKRSGSCLFLAIFALPVRVQMQAGLERATANGREEKLFLACEEFHFKRDRNLE